MSDTPLTDAKAMFFGYNPEEGDEFVQADFARDLERQNTALREALKTALGIEAIDDESLSELVSRCKSIIDAARKEGTP